jgi:ABC-type enterochelin transport system ATPase subunit
MLAPGTKCLDEALSILEQSNFTVTTGAKGDIVAFWREYHSQPRPFVTERAERLLREAIDVLENEIHRVRSV